MMRVMRPNRRQGHLVRRPSHHAYEMDVTDPTPDMQICKAILSNMKGAFTGGRTMSTLEELAPSWHPPNLPEPPRPKCGPIPIAPRIQFGGVAWSPHASKARLHPEPVGLYALGETRSRPRASRLRAEGESPVTGTDALLCRLGNAPPLTRTEV